MKTSVAVVLLFACAALMWLPVASDMGAWGDDMWHLAFLQAGAARRTLLGYGQFPFWNPYAAGGEPLLAYPMSSFLSPSFAFTLGFGPVAGPKLTILLGLFLGLWGGYLLGKKIAPGRFAPFLCAFLYMFSSWYPLYMSRWHNEFIPFAYIPWILLFYLKGKENLRWCAAGGLALALMIFQGGVYPVCYGLLFLALYAVVDAVVDRGLSPLKAFLLMAFLGLMVSGIKLLPMYDFLARFPRLTAWYEPVLPWRALPRMFIGADQLGETNFSGAWLGWWEYGAYVGLVPLGLALAAPFLSLRRAAPAAVTGLVFLALMFGDYGQFSPWHWLHGLPPFLSMHDPVRFRVIVVLSLTLLAALSVSRLEQRARTNTFRRGRLLWLVCGAVTVIAVLDLIMATAPLYMRVSSRPALVPRRAGPFRQTRLPKAEQQGPRSFLSFLRNEGLINNYDPMFLPAVDARAYFEPGYRGEVWLESGEGRVETVDWTPNRLSYAMRARGPGILVVNQRWDPGWRSADGRPVVPRRGLISVRVTPGDDEVTLYYRPPLFFPGLALTAAGLLVCVLLFYCNLRG